jgi:hypothetical protein
MTDYRVYACGIHAGPWEGTAVPPCPACSRPTAFDDFIAAVGETNPGAQACLVVLDGDVTPPLDIEGFIMGVRLDGDPWLRAGADAAFAFGARALRCDPEPDVPADQRALED